MAQVVRASEVRLKLEAEGWTCVHCSPSAILLRDGADRLYTIPCHPVRPDLILLSDLLQNVPVLRQEFVSIAQAETSVEDPGFEILVSSSSATAGDLEAFFGALSKLNQALGGAGLSFRQSEKVLR